MFRAALAILALSACASTPKPGLDDFGAMRFSQDSAERTLFERLLADAEAVRNEGWGEGPISEQPERCDSETLSRVLRGPWVRLAAAAETYEDWRRDEAAIRERLAQVTLIETAYLAGETPDPRYVIDAETWNVAALAAARDASTDSRVQELLARAIRDQVTRIVAYGDASAPFIDGLSESARGHWPYMLPMAHVDCSNTAWMRRQIAEHGWFDISRYGERVDEAAWLIVQHADRTPAFQGEMLTLLQARAAAGETSPRRVAYLWDRVAVKEGRPQRYGTQMACEDGEAQPIGGIEDAEHIEERVTALGMQSFASYRQMMTSLARCAD